MEQHLSYYLAIGFLMLLAFVQWLTNKWLSEERDWLKQKILVLMPGRSSIIKDSRLTEEYMRYRRGK